jgi:hypothetical protein
MGAKLNEVEWWNAAPANRISATPRRCGADIQQVPRLRKIIHKANGLAALESETSRRCGRRIWVGSRGFPGWEK